MEKKAIFSLIVIFVMVFSVFGFVLNFVANPDTVTEYGDYKFRATPDGYKTKINGKEFIFISLPSYLEFISLPKKAIELLTGRQAYTLTYNPESGLKEIQAGAQYYMEQQLQKTNIYLERGLTNNTGTSLPQRTCTDATEFQPVIYMKQSNESSITAEKNCIIIQSQDQQDVPQQMERILYTILGVMK